MDKGARKHVAHRPSIAAPSRQSCVYRPIPRQVDLANIVNGEINTNMVSGLPS